MSQGRRRDELVGGTIHAHEADLRRALRSARRTLFLEAMAVAAVGDLHSHDLPGARDVRGDGEMNLGALLHLAGCKRGLARLSAGSRAAPDGTGAEAGGASPDCRRGTTTGGRSN